MKKLIAILLTLAMFATMIPVLTVGVSAETAAPEYEDTWADHYDLSWITPSQTSSANTVTVGDKHYQVNGYVSGTTFEIDSADELAGLAYLVNAKNWGSDNNGTNSAFLNCTIKIVKDINLEGHYWISIGKTFNNKFGAKLVGDNNGEAITISNMTINSTEASSTEPPRGLVGTKTGGSIENINLTNAYITTAGFRVGSFAGQFNNATIKNCSSDATIVTTAENTDNAWDACGGMVGCTYGGNNGVKIESCTFTGTIDSVGEIAGGMVGTSEGSLTISDCTVNSAKIANGNGETIKENHMPFVGVSGLVGSTRNGFTATGTSVTATVVSNSKTSERAGGMVGSLVNNSTVTLTNCSFAGSVESTVTANAFLGEDIGKSGKLNLTNCTNNGTLVNDDSVAQLKFGQGTYTDGVVTSLSAQKSTLEGVKAVRVVAQVKAEALTGAGFDFVVSYKDAETEETVTTKVNSVELTKAFEAIKVDGTETAAAEGYVWVAFVLNNITADSVTISAVANATYTDSTVYGTVGSATIALA